MDLELKNLYDVFTDLAYKLARQSDLPEATAVKALTKPQDAELKEMLNIVRESFYCRHFVIDVFLDDYLEYFAWRASDARFEHLLLDGIHHMTDDLPCIFLKAGHSCADYDQCDFILSEVA